MEAAITRIGTYIVIPRAHITFWQCVHPSWCEERCSAAHAMALRHHHQAHSS